MFRLFNPLLQRLESRLFNWRVRHALKLHLRGEARSDGLRFRSASSSLEIEWRARDIHPWDKTPELKDHDAQFVRQAITDTEAVILRLFANLPQVDLLAIRVCEPSSDRIIMSGDVLRSSLALPRPLSERMWLGLLGISFHIVDNRFQPLPQGEIGDRNKFKPQGLENRCT